MTFYDTTREQVEAASLKLALTFRMTHALLERGNTVEEIATMSADRKMEELMSWDQLSWRVVIQEAIAVGLVKPA